jgi:hypothetical protein
MPYKNAYNAQIAQQVRNMSQNHVNREKEINDFATNYEIPSQVESSVMRYPEVHGGSGYAAATVADLGFEPTLGATSSDAKPRRARKKTIEVGEGLSAAGVSAAGVSAAGASAGGVSAEGTKRTRGKKKGEGATGGALLTLKDLDKMHGQPPDAMRAKVTVKAEGMDRAVGSGVSGGGRRGQRNTIVREVMQKHGLTLPQASKYVKENNLY